MQRILILKPDGTVEEKTVDGNIDEALLDDLLNGEIEEVSYLKSLEEQGIVLLQNERGKLLMHKPSVRVVKDGKLLDVLFGSVLIVGVDDEWYVGLNNRQVDCVKKTIKTATVSYPTPFLIII